MLKRVDFLLSYDPETGKFFWRVSRYKVKAGSEAGYLNRSKGYIEIKIDGKSYYAHQVGSRRLSA
jgi:hypothetical protein